MWKPARQCELESLGFREGATRSMESVGDVMADAFRVDVFYKCACLALLFSEGGRGEMGGDASRHPTDAVFIGINFWLRTKNRRV